MALSTKTLEPALYRYRFGSAEFDEARFELMVGGLPIELENKPLRVLATLLHQPGRVISKAELKKNVWDDRLTVEQVLTNAVTKLRKALGEEGQRIVTVPRLGYRLTGPVQRVAVGQRLLSRLKLNVGDVVPNRMEFVLESQLGATYGSEVWLARHSRSAAPRVFKFSIDGEHLATLKREATIFRLLREGLGERDDLVKVLDWNFEVAPFHLECEYGGENLLRWAEQGRLTALTLKERLEIFLQIASAVAAAHSVGVLHRDLKPDNVLIEARDDGSRRLRVADFGSGRLLDPERLAELTVTGLDSGLTRSVVDDSRTGTPLYLAPELITGEPPTVRSDIYALGYMLYQVVVADLGRPMATGWERDLDDELLREDIAAATEGSPSRRLASVAELIDRLQRLAPRHIERARAKEIEQRALAAERALEQSRARRPWLIAAIASLVAGLVVSLWLYREQSIARAQAQHESARAETINRFLNEDLLSATDPSGPGAGGDLHYVLSRAATRLATRFTQQPETEAALALTIGNAYFGLSDYATAESYQRRSFELFRSTRGSDDVQTLEASYRLARTLEMETKNQEAEALLTNADRDAGQRLQEKSDLALLAHWIRGGNWFMQMRPDKALPEFEAMESIRRQLYPSSEVWLFRARENLAWCYARLGQPQKAVQELEPLLQSQYTPENIGILDWTKSRLYYGLALVNLSRFDDAERTLNAAFSEIEAKLGPDHYLTAATLSYLAAAYQARGDWGSAIGYARQAYDVTRRRLGDQAEITVLNLGALGTVEYLGGQRQEGIKAMEQAHTALTQQLGAGDAVSQLVTFYLASAYHDIGRNNDALALLANCDPISLGYFEPDKHWQQRVQGLKGQILLALGNASSAEPMIRAAVDRMSRDNAPAWQLEPLRRALTEDAATRSKPPAGSPST
jgi:non-specific serine/threonine protein kinase